MTVAKERFTARPDKPVVLFLIGMRINRWLAVGDWVFAARAMPRMIAELARRPDSGLLWFHSYYSGRTTLMQQYWESFDRLLAYAHDRSGQHFPAWAEFNRRAALSQGAVGVWHETYLIEPGKAESIYVNMPPFGLAAATIRVPAEGHLATAKDRFGSASAE